MTLLTQAALLASAAFVLWRLATTFLTRSPLDNIRGPARDSFWNGNLGAMFNQNGWAFHEQMVEKYGAVAKFYGTFGARRLYVSDPKALSYVLLKEQTIYEESPWFISWNLITFGQGLVSTLGDQHRKQRKMMNPVFSIAHMRHLTPIFYETVHRLRKAMLEQVKGSPKEIDMLHWLGRTALELIGQGGLGYSFDPLTEQKDNDFGDSVKAVVPLSFALHSWQQPSQYLPYLGTPQLRRRLANWYLPTQNMRRFRDAVNVMERRSIEIIENKKDALKRGNVAASQQAGEGKDIMSVLLNANMETAEKDKLTEAELVGQMATFILAGMDTTSNGLSRILYLLCKHPNIQEKMREEIVMAACDADGDLPYDRLVELPYMDAVCRETLRLYSPVTTLDRTTREDTVMPLSKPIRGVDGKLIHEIPIPKNTTIAIGIHSCNRNKEIWGEDAHEFKPERWLSPLPETVTDARIPGVYSNLMTFIGGGRSCIGFKFSQLEMKVVLFVLLQHFRFSLSKKDIVWNLSGVAYPSVGSTSLKGELPLIVEMIKPETPN